MMTILLLIGLILTPSAHAQNTQGDTLYEYVHGLVRQAEKVIHVDLPSERYSAGIYYDNPVKNTSMEIDEEDVNNAVAKLIPRLCGGENTDPETCRVIMAKLDAAVDMLNWQRQLGRDLQMIATGYESGISDYPGKGLNIIPRLPSITRIWRSANEKLITPIIETSAAGLPYPPENKDVIEEEIETLIGDRLSGDLVRWKGEQWDDSEMVAAVWKYRNGVKYIETTEEGTCNSSMENPDTEELMLLKKRWCAVERQLLKIHDLIIGPYTTGGKTLPQDDFLIFPTWTDQESNIVIWVRGDDIGLQWNFAIEPVQPMLYNKDYNSCIESGGTPEGCHDADEESLVRGGTYPDVVPEPEEAMGICSHPFSKNGYLCRQIEDTECNTDPVKVNAQGILLTRCSPEKFNTSISIAPSGPDICEIGGWRSNIPAVENNVKDTPEKQSGPNPVGEEIKPSMCASCAVDFYCANTCEGSETIAFAEDKENGVIRLCLTDTLAEMGLLQSLITHELVHAQQMCNLDAKSVADLTNTVEKCCAVERESYLAQCNMLAGQGILDRAGYTVDECASAGANGSCESFSTDGAGACSPTEIESLDMWEDISETILKGLDDGWLEGIPTTCRETVEKLEPTAQAIISSLPLACTPSCIAEYENTIGNNLCFAGQCLEQSLEWQRLIPGRMPLTSGDEAYPWDSCPVEDPQYGKFFSPPALTAPHFPAYNPQRLYEELDRALCQLNGLPASSPPILCAFDPRRRLNLPVSEFIGMAQSLLEQSGEVQKPATGLLNAASGVGSRKANEFFFGYLEKSMKSFTEIMQITSTIMVDIAETQFPSVMCPRTADENICGELSN